MVAFAEIQDLAHRIVREFDPDKIILFGSHANQTQRTDSDVDLLVILSFAGKNWQKAAQIRGRVRSPFPMDLIVRAPDEVHQRVQAGDPFLRDIMERGIVLHARDHAGIGAEG